MDTGVCLGLEVRPGGLGPALEFLSFSVSLCKWKSLRPALPVLQSDYEDQTGVLPRLSKTTSGVRCRAGDNEWKVFQGPHAALRAVEPVDAIHFSGLALKVELMSSGS